jgi:hypothetical protein
MAKPNYAFQKRQRELAKKQKKEAKQKAKEQQNAPEAVQGEATDTPVADPSKPVE